VIALNIWRIFFKQTFKLKEKKNETIKKKNQWKICLAFVALVFYLQPANVLAGCSNDDHELVIISQSSGVSLERVKYRASRESGWMPWYGWNSHTTQVGDELSTNKIDSIQWPWDSCYDIDWEITVKYNEHTLTEEFSDLEGDHKWAATVLVGSGGAMKFLPVATSSNKTTAIQQAMENAADYYKWVADNESETDWLDRDGVKDDDDYDWQFLQSISSDDERFSQFFDDGDLSGTIYWNNGANKSWNQSYYENIRPSGLEVRRKFDGLSIEDFISQYEDGNSIGPKYYDVIDGFESRSISNSTLLDTGRSENDGMTVQEFFDFEVKYYYGWTNWLDLDDEGGDNDGDIEYLHELYNNGRIGCESPVEIQCRKVGSSNVLNGTSDSQWIMLQHEGVKVYCDAGLGFACLDDNNSRKCSDWEVRFYCDNNESTTYDRPTLSLQESLPDYALEFDGTGSFVFLNPAPTLGNSFTQEAWIYPTHTDDTFHGFMGYQPNRINQSAPGLWCKGKKIYYGFGNGSQWLCTTTGDVLTLNDWNHVAVTFDGTNYKLYINGQQVHNYTGASGKTPYGNPVHLIGRVDNFFEGMIDEVRIWNVARTKSQIQSNMDNTLSGSETGLVAYYKFEEISGGFTVTDKTSNNYDGIFIGNVQFVLTTTLWK
jgi:hypothetical protein